MSENEAQGMQNSTDNMKAIQEGKNVSLFGLAAGVGVAMIGLGMRDSSITKETISTGNTVYEVGRNVAIAAGLILFGLITVERKIRNKYKQDMGASERLS